MEGNGCAADEEVARVGGKGDGCAGNGDGGAGGCEGVAV